MAAKFIEYSGTEKEVFYGQVKAEINSLRECYHSKQIETWSDEYLAWMFLVDGCALLFFIDHVAEDNLKALGGKDDLLAYAKLDLFLLENQLPYQLLQILMSSCTRVPRNPQDEKHKKKFPTEEKEEKSPAEVLKRSITIFIHKNTMCPVDEHEEQEQGQKEKLAQQEQQEHLRQQQLEIMIDQTQRDAAHLLELLWRRLTKSKKDKKSDGTMSKGISYDSNPGDMKSESNSNPDGKKRNNWHTFRNVKELKEKGIWLKVSEKSGIGDISFQENFLVATLWLPPITVDDFTWPKFMNLIAYEMCPDFKNEFEITSYVSFLDSLIDSREDVKELKDARVLHNGLGSDKAVALLFNEISKNLVPNPGLHFDLKCRIQAHCNTAFATYVAQLYHIYFRNPWSILAFLVVLLGLGMTAMQTYEGF